MQSGIDYIGVNVSFVCHDGKGKVLLHLRSDKNRDEHNTWDFGAGQVEFGETLEEAVIREIFEEYGCRALDVKEVVSFTNIRQHAGVKTHWLTTLFAARVNPTEVRVMEPKKNLRNEWYSIDALPQPLHSAVAREVTDFRSEIEAALKK